MAGVAQILMQPQLQPQLPLNVAGGSGVSQFVMSLFVGDLDVSVAQMNGKAVDRSLLSLPKEKKIKEQDSIFSNGFNCSGTFSCTSDANQPSRQAIAATMGIIRSRRSMQTRSLTEPDFGNEQQLSPNVMPDGVPPSNSLEPMVQRGQQGQQPGGIVGADPVQQGQQQMLPGTHVYRYPPGPNVAGGMLSVSYNIRRMPLQGGGSPPRMPIGQLATLLVRSSPRIQRNLLGENVYPLVKELQPERAAKITGMLLEMNPIDVLHLLESPEAMRIKVAEAMSVLRNAFPEQFIDPVDQLPELSRDEGV